MNRPQLMRARWAAIGAALAVSIGAGGVGLAHATQSGGERAVYTAISPCRLVDTRPAFQVGPRSTPLGAGDIHTVSTWGANGECSGIPNDVVAVGLNVTAVGATAPTFLTIWPDGPRPNASSLNPSPGAPPVPNAVTTDVSGSGSFDIYNLAGNVDVVIDLVGVYRHHTHDDRYYTKAQTDALVGVESTCPASRFLPSASSTPWTGTATRHYPGSGVSSFSCPIDLPVGATVTELRGFLIDAAATIGGACTLNRVQLAPGADGSASVLAGTNFTTNGVSGIQVLSDTSIVDATVQSGYAYHISCGTGVNLEIVGATVFYTR